MKMSSFLDHSVQYMSLEYLHCKHGKVEHKFNDKKSRGLDTKFWISLQSPLLKYI